MERICETCRFWEPDASGASGECLLLSGTIQSDDDRRRAVENRLGTELPSARAGTWAEYDYPNGLSTDADFGCVLHEEA